VSRLGGRRRASLVSRSGPRLGGRRRARVASLGGGWLAGLVGWLLG
jgi:hypothetical protein